MAALRQYSPEFGYNSQLYKEWMKCASIVDELCSDDSAPSGHMVSSVSRWRVRLNGCGRYPKPGQ